MTSSEGAGVSDSGLRTWVLLTVAALVGVIGLGAVGGSRAVADDLRSTAESRLADAGLDGVSVDFVGREAELSGGSRADREEARAIVAGITGVRRTAVEPGTGDRPTGAAIVDASAARLHLVRTSRGARISGVVPDADAQARIRAAAAAAFGTIRGDLTVDDSIRTDVWTKQVANAFDDVVGVKGLTMRVEGDGVLRLDGTIESPAGRDAVVALVERTLTDLEVDDGIRVDPGRLGEVDARILNATRLVFEPGSDVLSYVDQQQLDAVAGVLDRHPGVRVEAGGHVGPRDLRSGERLGRRRAAAVKAYLVGRGVERTRVTTRTYGSDPSATAHPIAEQYRRVDLIVLEG
ncbi:MAG: OmpA family protein [Aeromicrobium sp.]